MRVTGTTKKNLLEFADVIIDTLQMSVYSKYMPPGPNYNQAEKEWAIEVANTVMPQSMDLMWSSVKLAKDRLKEKAAHIVRGKTRGTDQREQQLKQATGQLKHVMLR